LILAGTVKCERQCQIFMAIIRSTVFVNYCLPYVYTLYVSTQVTLAIELDDSQLSEFESMIPVQLAQPPWNYTSALSKGITVYAARLHHLRYITCLRTVT